MRLSTEGIWFTLDFCSGKVCFVSLAIGSFVVRDHIFRRWIGFFHGVVDGLMDRYDIPPNHLPDLSQGIGEIV